MTRSYGRAPKGSRCVDSAPLGDWQTTTFVAGLRHHQLTAPMVLDGPMDGELFLAWVEQFLCPTLQPGDIVILDNLSSHKVDGVQQAVAAGRRYGALSAALFARPEPHRKALLQTQNAAPQSRPPSHRRTVEGNRNSPQHHHRQRMRKLLHLVWICKHLNQKCSSGVDLQPANPPRPDPMTRLCFQFQVTMFREEPGSPWF